MRGRQCRICRNKNEVAEGEELLPVGCKCFAAVHLSCAIRAAQASEDMWMLCPKCQCRWGGDLDQGLFEAAPHPPEHEMQTCRVCLKQATSERARVNDTACVRPVSSDPKIIIRI